VCDHIRTLDNLFQAVLLNEWKCEYRLIHGRNYPTRKPRVEGSVGAEQDEELEDGEEIYNESGDDSEED